MGAESLLGAASGATPWGAAAQAFGGLLNTGIGLLQRRKGKKLLKQLGDQPLEEMPSELMQNQRMAQENALTGLPSQQYSMAMQNLQRQQSNAINSAQSRRGALGLIGKIQQGTNDGTLKLDVANANARLQNQRTLYGVNSQVAGWKDKLYNNNVLNPWNRKYQYAQSLTGSGNQNMFGGIDQLGAAGLMYGSQGGFNGGGGYGGGYGGGDISVSTRPRAGLNYIPYDEQFPG